MVKEMVVDDESYNFSNFIIFTLTRWLFSLAEVHVDVHFNN